MEILGVIADLVGVASAVFALLAWLKARQIQQQWEQERQRQNRRITVVLQNGAQPIRLPVELRRAEMTRAEVLGRIGMIPMKEKGKRFSLEYLNTPEFLRQIDSIIAADDSSLLTIPCTLEEIDQFDLSRY